MDDERTLSAPDVRGARARVTLLLVDDNESVREFVRDVLVDEGYRVLEAGSAADALAVEARHAGPIRMLITDVIMPGWTGPELVQEMHQRRGSVALLYISGYTGEQIENRVGYLPFGALLPKPFTADELLERVREILESDSGLAAA